MAKDVGVFYHPITSVGNKLKLSMHVRITEDDVEIFQRSYKTTFNEGDIVNDIKLSLFEDFKKDWDKIKTGTAIVGTTNFKNMQYELEADIIAYANTDK